MDDDSGRTEITELSHEPWPGFRPAFLLVFAAACVYLAAVLLATLPGVLRHP